MQNRKQLLSKEAVGIKASDILFSNEYENVCKHICLKGNDTGKYNAFYEFEDFLIKMFINAKRCNDSKS